MVDSSQFEHDNQTYAPVVWPTTLRILFAATAWHSWTIRQLDFVVAFLNGQLRDTVYMRQPTGFEQGEKGKLVCRLNQALYGLDPAARIWYDTMTATLRSIGFKPCPYDPGLFVHEDRRHLYLSSHVDDCMVVAEDPANAEWVISTLSQRFELKDMGQISHYLGTDVEFRDNGIRVHQTQYAQEVVQSFGQE